MSATVDRRPRLGSRPLGAVGLIFVAGYCVLLTYLMSRSTFDAWGALLVAPVLVMAAVPLLYRQAIREGDLGLFALLVWALVLRLAASMVGYYIAFGVYGGVADAHRYLDDGAAVADNFRHLIFSPGVGRWTDTSLPTLLVGTVQTLIGPTSLGTYLVFSWIGFWGLFLFYRAFTIGVPEGSRRSYARLVFFLPSLLFWPSVVGKEAWMVFGLGLAAFGGARLLVHGFREGVVPIVLGIAACAIVRPHIAAMFAIALVAGYVVRPSPPEHRETALLIKTLVLVAMAIGTLFLVRMTENYLTRAGVGGEGGITDTLQSTMFRTQLGGSSFNASILDSPYEAPKAAVTVMFRPLIPEAKNAQGLIAATEGTLLLAWSLWRWRWIVQSVRSVRRQPYVATAITFVAVFIFGFSSFANFGLLVRQRSQVLPFFLVILAVPTADWRTSHPAKAEEVSRADTQQMA